MVETPNSEDHASFTVPSIVVIVGPTAAGKSRLALALAQRYEADIVTADSRQVYRYMDIGTAKLTVAEGDRKPPHFRQWKARPSEGRAPVRFQRRRVSRQPESIGGAV